MTGAFRMSAGGTRVAVFVGELTVPVSRSSTGALSFRLLGSPDRAGTINVAAMG